MIRSFLILALGGGFLASAALAEGDPEAGRKIAGMCRTCHGLDGIARVPIAPHIAGEPVAYLAAQLTAFRDGKREHEMMSVVAKGLSDDQILNVSSWYAAHGIDAALPKGAETAQAPEHCTDCHGETGLSALPDVPHLAGETNIYIETQLKAFRTGKRVHDVMSPIAAELSDDDIRALADWFAAVQITVSSPD